MNYFLLGLLTSVVFFICVGGGYYLGTKKTHRPKPPDVDPDEKQRIERYNKHFKELFSYSEEKALQRKQVHK